MKYTSRAYILHWELFVYNYVQLIDMNSDIGENEITLILMVLII